MAASLSPAQKKEDFKEEFLTCSICSEPYDNAKHKAKCLPCLHTYCKSCLERIASKQSQIDCPNCRKLVRLPGGTVDSLPHNFLVENLKEYQDIFNSSITCGTCGDRQAASFCHECGLFLCHKCVNAQKQFGPHRHHTLSTMLELQERQCNPMAKRHRHCTKHPQQDLTMYCKEINCKIPVCAACGLVDHQGHVLVELSTAIEQIIIDMRRSVAEVSAQNQKLAVARSEQEKYQDTLNKIFKKQEKEIETAAQKLYQEIDASKKKAHAQLKKLYESEMTKTTTSLDSINILSAEMTSAMDFVNQSCDRNHPTQLLTSQRQIMDRLSGLKRAELPNLASNETGFDFTMEHHQAMTQIQKSLQDFCGVGWAPLPPDPQMCTVQLGIDVTDEYCEYSKAIVTTVDCKGRRLTTGGAKVYATESTERQVESKKSSPRSMMPPMTLHVTDNNDGTYSFTYDRIAYHRRHLDIVINGTAMKGSPFQIPL